MREQCAVPLTIAAGGAPMPGSLEELMQRLAETGRSVGVRVSRVRPDELITPYPMLRLGNDAVGLLQVRTGKRC
jgi:hypothetical protein